MDQDFKNIDTFLRNASFEVEDNGFTERVIGLLPKHAEWECKLQRIWQLVCLTAAILIGWLTNIVDVVCTDLKVMLDTLPLNYNLEQIILLAFLPLVALSLLTLVWSKRLIY